MTDVNKCIYVQDKVNTMWLTHTKYVNLGLTHTKYVNLAQVA